RRWLGLRSTWTPVVEPQSKRMEAGRGAASGGANAGAGGKAGSSVAGHLGGEVDGCEHVGLVGFAGADDVVGSAVIDRCADDRQAEGDVDSVVEAGELARNVTLVVVHRHDRVEVAKTCAQKDRVG